MMYLFLKEKPSPDAPYQLLFVTVTESGGGWVTLYAGDRVQTLVLEQHEFPTLEVAIGRGISICEELLKNGWRPYHPAVAGLNRSSYGAALEALQRD
jgi:hypothetical protein